jgi:putative transposase
LKTPSSQPPVSTSGDVDTGVLSLVAKGLTTGEVSAHFEEIYGAVFIDAIDVKVRDGQVAERPFYAAIGGDFARRKNVLRHWAGTGVGESAKLGCSRDRAAGPRRRRRVLLVCDAPTGLPDSVRAVFPEAVAQTCLIHLIRNTFRYAPKVLAASCAPPGSSPSASRTCMTSVVRSRDREAASRPPARPATLR